MQVTYEYWLHNLHPVFVILLLFFGLMMTIINSWTIQNFQFNETKLIKMTYLKTFLKDAIQARYVLDNGSGTFVITIVFIYILSLACWSSIVRSFSCEVTFLFYPGIQKDTKMYGLTTRIRDKKKSVKLSIRYMQKMWAKDNWRCAR